MELIAIEWGAYGVPETFLIYNKKIIKKIIGPLNEKLISEIKEINKMKYLKFIYFIIFLII